MADEIEAQSHAMSEPPALKAARVQADTKLAVFGQLFGAMTDWLGIIVLGGLIYVGKLPGEPWAYVIAGLAGGTALNKLRGKSGGSTTALVALGLPAAAKNAGAVAAVKHILSAAVLGLVLTSCVSSGAPAFDPAATRAQANEMRSDLNDLADELVSLRPMIEVVCAVRGDMSAQCKDLERYYEDVRAGIGAARKAVTAYDEGGLAIEAAETAAMGADKAVRDFADAATSALEAVQHATSGESDRGSDGVGGEGGGAVQAPTAAAASGGQADPGTAPAPAAAPTEPATAGAP